MSDFVVKTCLAYWKTSKFKEELADEIAQHGCDLSLDEFCDKGGSPDTYVEIEELDFEESEPDFIEGSFSIAFTESYYNGCKDIDWIQKYSGTMSFEMNIATGEITITGSDISEVEEDTEEEE